MPETFVSPPVAYSSDSSMAESFQEVKTISDTSPSSSSSSPISNRSLECSYFDLPSPHLSPRRWSTQSNGSPSFRERLRSASRLVRNMSHNDESQDTCREDAVEPVIKAKADDGFKSFFREHFILSEL